MKKRLSIGIITILILTSLIGCTADTETPKESAANPETDQVTESETETVTESLAKVSESETNQTDKATQIEIEVNVYHSDENAMNLISDSEIISELTPENLMEKLAAYNIVPTDATVNSFEEIEDEGEKALNLDLSEEFATAIRQMGTTGEFYMLKGLCNTFLDAYDADKIQLTIDGEMLATGHAEIEGYMYFYKKE